MKTVITTISLTAIILTLTGCMEMVYDGARLTKDKAHKQIWRSLANDGDVEAQYKLGSLYCCGERPYFNNVEALNWWCKAAKGGQRDAQFEVGKMFGEPQDYKGNIIPKDRVLAYTYYTIADKNGHPEASKKARKLDRDMTEEEVEQADALLARWPRIYCKIER